MNNAAMSMDVQISLQKTGFSSFGYVPRNAVAGHIAALFLFFKVLGIEHRLWIYEESTKLSNNNPLPGSSFFSFEFSIFIFPPTVYIVPFSLDCLQDLLPFNILIKAILTGMK